MDAVQTAIKDKIIVVQGRQVILDSDVAALYGVETKRVNEAIKNNPDKFPDGYILQLTPSEWEDLRSKISTTKSAKVRYAPKAFTEKGLYMLATILKSPVATQTTIGIIETFAKVKELSRTMSALQEPNDPHLQERLCGQGSPITKVRLPRKAAVSSAICWTMLLKPRSPKRQSSATLSC